MLVIEAIDLVVRPRQSVMDTTIEGKEGPAYLSSSEPVDFLRVKKGTKHQPKKSSESFSAADVWHQQCTSWQPIQKVLRRSP